MIKTVLVILLVLILLVLGWLVYRRATMTAPENLGVQQGRLAPCPSSPNCVSSYADDAEHKVEPLPLAGDPAAAMAKLREILEGMPRTEVVDAGDRYLRAECTSALWGFVDDLELLVDPEAGKVHVRSASRVGRSDLGVNRERVAELAEAWAAAAR